MRPYPLYILDLDGTLYRGDEPVAYAVDAVKELRARGAMIRFLTNNSGQTRGFYVDKLRRLGFEAMPQEIYSSALGSAAWVKSEGLTRLFYVGEDGLRETLESEGLVVVNGAETQADAVVAGICRAFNFSWLNDAMQQILGGAKFVATNRDPTYPVENGGQIPGAGAIISAIETCTGQEPFVVGKPNPYLIKLILNESGVLASNGLVVGDRMDTDILSGQRAGCPTHLVLTGVTGSAPKGQPFSEDLRALL